MDSSDWCSGTTWLANSLSRLTHCVIVSKRLVPGAFNMGGMCDAYKQRRRTSSHFMAFLRLAMAKSQRSMFACSA
jgi:hypothetical protein